jgi:hypothetical protein
MSAEERWPRYEDRLKIIRLRMLTAHADRPGSGRPRHHHARRDRRSVALHQATAARLGVQVPS